MMGVMPVRPTVLTLAELHTGGAASLFQGDVHGDGVPLSIFVTEWQPGDGPRLHFHPYAEVFLVQDGKAVFAVDGDEHAIDAGHIVVVPPETPHTFRNAGDGVMRLLSFQPAGTVQQTWV
jgi:quercetin dioxygenase-like cupin family protein